jgi:hypothetical protein
MNTSIQLNFFTKTNAQNAVVERTTLVNVACNSVTEAAELYEELKTALGRDIVVSHHQELTRIPNHTPKQLAPSTTVRQSPGACEHCGAGLVLRTARKGPRAGQQFWSCSSFHTRGCLYTKPA